MINTTFYSLFTIIGSNFAVTNDENIKFLNIF